MAEKNKKSNFFKEAFKSIKDLDKYEDFALETPKVSFKYFIKLILVFVVIISFFYTLKIVDNCKNVYSTMKTTGRLKPFSRRCIRGSSLSSKYSSISKSVKL